MMELFGAPASPFVRKVRVLLAETGYDDMVTFTPVATAVVGEADAAIKAANPLGKIPALQRPDGPALYDSRVICRYLDAKFTLEAYPASRLWEVLTLEATADGIMDAGVLMVYERRFRPAEKQDDAWIDGQWAKIARALDAIEDRWMSHLAAPIDMSQIAVGCALGYLDFRHADRSWREGRPALAAWADTFLAREAMIATTPSN
ncbi:putative glutathione S-transferase family protein [Dinoroseobacter shibae DFL 12 = DSM 16493]|jgi:glutathione S-transferase|uniref:glutathione transferase n=2 Tax=Dinoroseobacter shibae TaxID=215813 RepID=A8LMT7_DINSH|nr:putative glutathione S-transferase family protein [Dinoroseobacter shibae DFL 12 = DSM 16493]